VFFWAWNDRLRREKLIWQIREMREKGFGGYFMHARIGLVTEYLSEKWMEKIQICAQEAARKGPNAWLYDEDRWPSGYGGGIVSEQKEEYRPCGLMLIQSEEIDSDQIKDDSNLVAIFHRQIILEGKIIRMKSVSGKSPDELEKMQEDIVAFKIVTQNKTLRFNNSTYVDVLNQEVTEAFIKSTYELYSHNLKDYIPGSVPGIFTDEPNCSGVREREVIPWTRNFPEFFQKRRGYDLLSRLPLLWFQGKGCKKVRYDYWRTVTELFSENFWKKLYAWCDQHNLQLTGHLLHEETLQGQIRCNGAAMPHYEYIHVPGVDHLGRNTDNILPSKQVSSVAHQLGKKRILCEIFGASGHSLSFEDQKRIADHDFVLGVNFINPHLYLYSMRGCRKRDYPPTISYQQPYWRCYRTIADYFARLSYVLSQGEFVCDILLLHPIGSVWMVYEPLEFEVKSNNCEFAGGANARVLNDEFTLIAKKLSENHRDYDLGDEILMEKYGSVEEGKLIIGRSIYSTVIVPPSISWTSTTFNLLKKFVQQGGQLIFIKPLPSCLDAEFSEIWKELIHQEKVEVVENDKKELSAILDRISPRDISIRDEQGEEIADIYYQHRRIDEKQLYFLTNKSRRSYRAEIELNATGKLQEWSPINGKVSEVYYRKQNKKVSFNASFAPVQSHLYMLDSKDLGSRTQESVAKQNILKSIQLADTWDIQRTDYNCLLLDYCRYRIEDGYWSRKVSVWRAQDEIQKHYGLPETKTNSQMQPWKAYKSMKPLGPGARISLEFEFESKITPTENERIILAMETPEEFNIKVNSKSVYDKLHSWWIDKAIKKIDITPLLQKGKNIVVISCTYRQDIELENLYVLGDFKVIKSGSDQNFILAKEEKSLYSGDWVSQGYPFYCGGTVYLQDVKLQQIGYTKAFLRLRNPAGSVFRVSVNEKEVGILVCPPWEIDISSFIKLGDNKIAIEVVSTLRNAFGPHHHTKGELLRVEPRSFSDERSWTDEYNFVSYGLLEGAEIVFFG